MADENPFLHDATRMAQATQTVARAFDQYLRLAVEHAIWHSGLPCLPLRLPDDVAQELYEAKLNIIDANTDFIEATFMAEIQRIVRFWQELNASGNVTWL
jgi:hypothetical protein